ncbi:MAG: glycerol-3-phosphate 1-O-acyltransferase [Planctomycetota bacterium]|nr:MAG: glycerol-3-phosphate 1-O-acyltransferase [Planctomycetota bacterium]
MSAHGTFALGTTLSAPHGAEWLALALSYLLGAVPFSWLLARGLKGVDIRTIGSGNIGSTNAMRVLGKPLGVVAFVLDFAKGWLPVAVIAPRFHDGPDAGPGALAFAALCGVAAVVGHVWPIYLKFKGGKAVATTSGMVVALDPLVFVIGGFGWIAVKYGVGFVGLASMLMCALFPLGAAWRISTGDAHYDYGVVWVLAGLALLVVIRHRANIARMFAGTEPRSGKPGRREGTNP